MDIAVRASKRMDRSEIDKESRIVRVPKIQRVKHNLRLGEFLCMKRKDKGVEILQVGEVYSEDTDDNCVYVSSNTIDKLLITSKEINELIEVNNITLGCDPEAVLVHRESGEVIPACNYMRKYGDVGNDGLLIEFRPSPSTKASEVCDNLYALIVKARQMLNQHADTKMAVLWGGSSYGELNAGFHLHYGFPSGLLSSRAGAHRVANLITKAFDYYVGTPSIVPEGNKDVKRRTSSFMPYGKPGGFRLNNKTFEYRLPGGTNLKHPLLSEGLMALGAVVAEDVVSRINTATDNLQNLQEMMDEKDLLSLYPNLPNMETYYKIICNPDIGLAKHHLGIIMNDVRSMSAYGKMSGIVETYFNLLQDEVEFSNDIERNWGEHYYGKR